MASKSARHHLVLLSAILFFATPLPIQAALTFDLRAVSAKGTDVQLLNPKTVTVSSASTDGEITLELWGIVSGTNADLSDDRIRFFVVRALSTNQGAGAIRGDMANSPPPLLGLQSGFDIMPGSSPGSLADLDADGDLDIGGPVDRAANHRFRSDNRDSRTGHDCSGNHRPRGPDQLRFAVGTEIREMGHAARPTAAPYSTDRPGSEVPPPPVYYQW
jgi:hypothetical protein